MWWEWSLVLGLLFLHQQKDRGTVGCGLGAKSLNLRGVRTPKDLEGMHRIGSDLHTFSLPDLQARSYS